MKNHAFLILAHNQPELLSRIVSVLMAPNHYFFIHVDAKCDGFQRFRDATNRIGGGNAQFVNRIACYHCGVSLVYAEIALLKEAERHPAHFDYVHLISGQDYPLRTNRQFDEFFENTDESFMCYNFEEDMDYWRPIYDEKANWWHSNGTNGIIDRFCYRHSHSRLLNRLLPRRPIPNHAGGWQWFSWSDKVVTFVMRYMTEHPKLLRRFNHTGSPDEHYFTTMLYPYLDQLKIRKHFPLRYISWHAYHEVEQQHRPYNMDERDFDRVVNSAAFFCRKVDEVTSAKLLDMIDAQRGQRYDIREHDYFF